MIKQRIYIETTLFNFYFDTERDAHAATVTLFKEVAAGKYEAYTSGYVIDELERAPEEKRVKMLALIQEYDIFILEKSDEAERFASMYVSEGIIPAKYRTDGLHIAVAAIMGLDMIISLNFNHIVKTKTKTGTAVINIRYGCKPIQINSPMEVIEDEDI